MSKPETQAAPSGINWQTRAGSALALVALLGVGVAGGVSSYLQQREQRRQVAAATPEVTPIALAAKSGEPAPGGGTRTEAKTDVSPRKSEAATGKSGDKTAPAVTPSKTDVPPATKGTAKSDTGGKSTVEATKPSGIGKTTDGPSTGKEGGPKLEKTANPSAEPSKAGGTSKTTDSKTTVAKEGTSKGEKTAKPSAEPSKTSDTEKTKETRPSDGKKAPAAEPGKTSKSDDSSKASSPGAKEKSVGDVPPAVEPHKQSEPGKSAEPAKSGKAPEAGKTATPGDTTKAPPAGPEPGDDKQAATIVVQVPADAKVYFDGQATTQTGSERSFATPPLRRGAILYYELKAEFAPGGQVVSRTLRIAVRGGETTRVELTPASTRVISPTGR